MLLNKTIDMLKIFTFSPPINLLFTFAIIFFSFLYVIVLSSQTKSVSNSYSLVTKACDSDYKGWDAKLCLKILKSYPKITSSTYQLSLALNNNRCSLKMLFKLKKYNLLKIIKKQRNLRSII